jgi:type IV pilus assembly protein PilE
MRRSNRGFTLIEIMIVIAIIGIVVTIAAPLLTEYVKKSHRTEAAALLTEQAQLLERFHSKNNVYTNATGLSAGNEHYSIVAILSDQTFLLTAARKADSSMAADKCGDLTLSSTGAMSMINAAADVTSKDCWGR